MCGLAGYIGGSRNDSATFELMTSLFDQIEVRGTDAAGFWGVDRDDGKILYHKEPIKTSEFIKRPMWARIEDHSPDLLLVHARGASVGVGLPANNKNNHPFTSTCRTVGMVHNGLITEYDTLKKKFEVKSDCDSEVLLRIFEAGVRASDGEDELDISKRLHGIRDIWRHVPRGAMAVAIGERLENGSRRLFLFRNKLRSLWLADVRKTLGQIYFFSTPEIWHDAVQNCTRNIYRHVKKAKLIELPADEVWSMSITTSDPIVSLDNVKKFEVNKKGQTSYECRGDLVKIEQKPVSGPIFTRLNDNDDIMSSSTSVVRQSSGDSDADADAEATAERILPKTQIPKATHNGRSAPSAAEAAVNAALIDDKDDDDVRDAELGDLQTDDNEASLMDDNEASIMDDYSQQISSEHVTMTCEKIRNLISQIAVEVENKCHEQSMTLDKYQDLATSLEQTELDLEGTITMLRS
jgi:predicted glutamine amidotransferase